MILSDLFRRLSYGELSSTSMGNSGSGTIEEHKRNQVTQYINDALLKICTDFPVITKTINIQLYDYITYYHLKKEFSIINHHSSEPVKYILDTCEMPYENDAIKILGVYTPDGLHSFPLNDYNNHKSLFTPQANILQVPNPLNGNVIGVEYQARHRLLDACDDNVPILVPDQIIPAITSYVGYLAYTALGGQENKATASEMLGKYNAFVDVTKAEDTLNLSEVPTNLKLMHRGFE